MSQSDQKRSGGAGSGRQVYGTQMPGFGSDRTPASSSAPSVSGSGRQVFGTQMATPVALLAAQSQRSLPQVDNFRAVTRTQRADGSQLSLLAELARAQQAGMPVTTPVVSESGRSLLNVRLGSTQEVARRAGQDTDNLRKAAGRSTWNLRIHRRDVAGHITGIVNELPREQSGRTGLQSALAVDNSAPEYEVLAELGAGNMGVVYRARQLSLNRELAIKTLKPETTHADHDQALFVSEAVVTANLVHPNIVPIHDLGHTSDGKLFYSMKKVTGEGWDRLIRVRSLEDNLDIFMKLCDAVAYAHSRGVINRDLKPENVIVGDYGEVIVLDWGLAITTDKFPKKDSVVVEFRGGAGTPVYMPPELIDEDITAMGVHSDVYLLGAILFEILEGFPPHLLRRLWDLTDQQEQLNGVIWAVINNEIESDCLHSGELMQIARRAMATNPAERFGSVEELQEAIREYRITGRAEELLSAADSAGSSGNYANYQTAVALYGDALRRWPGNLRAQDGDRRARVAWAELALRRGDLELGQQIVTGQTHESFLPVLSRLKSGQRRRRLIRATLQAMTVAVAALMVASTFLWLRTAEALAQNEALYGDVQQQKKLVASEKAEADRQRELAKTEKELAAIAKSEAVLARTEANKARDEARIARSEAETASADAKKSRMEANLARMDADQQKELAAAEQMKAREAQEAAGLALKKAAEAEESAAQARNGAYLAELEGYQQLIKAAQELGDFNDVIIKARQAESRAPGNPLIQEKLSLLKDQIEDAIANGGNAQLLLEQKPDAAAISADGSTVVAYSRGSMPKLTVRRIADRAAGPVVHDLPAPKGSIRDVAVSADGARVCVVGKEEKRLWELQGDRYQARPLADSFPVARAAGNTRTFGRVVLSPDGGHLYLIGADEKATVEIYDLNQPGEQPVLRQALAGTGVSGFEVHALALVPDESALLVQTRTQECFAFRLKWTNGRPEFGALSNTAPRLPTTEFKGLNLDRLRPDRLAVSGDGKWLAAVVGDTVVLLERQSDAGEGDFPFSRSKAARTAAAFQCSFTVTDIAFSADARRIATANDRYIQLWDRTGDGWAPCSAPALYVSQSTSRQRQGQRAASLRGHSELVRALVFPGGDPDRLLSVSADRTLRSWRVSEYADLVQRMEDIVQVFASAASTPAPASTGETKPVTTGRRIGIARTSQRSPRQNVTSPSSSLKSLAVPRFTSLPVEPAPQEEVTAADTEERPRQGRGVFSARFSADGTRLLLGADDLAAHVLDAATGERVLTAAMAGREELFFNPDRNKFLEGHISEIATVQFLPPDGDLLLSADYFGSISVWDSAPGPDGVGYERSRLLSEYSFSEFAVSDDGSLVLAGGAATSDPTGRLQKADLKHMGVIWRTEDIRRSPGPSRYRTLENEHPDFAITAVALSPSSHRAVTAGRRGRIVVWDVATGKPLASVAESHNRDQVSGIFFETEEQLVSVGYDGRILRWTINGTALESTEIARAAGQSLPEFIVRLRPTRDRSRFVTSEVLVRKGEAGRQINELNIMIWSGNGARPLVDPPIPIPERDKEKAFRHDLSWSADGRELMLILDGVITVFETEGWTVTRKFRQDEENVRPVRGALAPTVEGTSTRAATFDGRFTHLWDLETGEHLAEFRSHAQYNVHAAFSPDNKYVATASETLRLFNADETSPDHGLTVYRLPNRTVHQSPVADVAFQPGVEGYRLASVDTQGRLELWTWTPGVADDSPLNSIFEAVTNETMSPSWAQDLLFGNTLAFDGDGRFLAALQRGSLAVWDMKGAQPVALNVPLPEDRKVRFNQLAFSRDGLLAAGGVSSDNETEALSSFAAIWRVASDGSLRLVGTIEGEHSIDTIAAGTSQTGILALAFDPVRGSIVTGGADNRLIRWQVRAMDQDRPVPLERIADVLRDGEEPHRDPVVAVEITADGHMVSADAAGYFVLWPRPEAAATP